MKIVLILLGSLLAIACSKNVSNGDGGTNIVTNPDNNAPNQLDLTINFSNHAEIGSPDNLYTPYLAQENIILSVPSSITTISYASATAHPNLILTLNNSYFCYYYWNSLKYVPHSSCNLSGSLSVADVLSLEGVPQGQTVTVKFKFQR